MSSDSTSPVIVDILPDEQGTQGGWTPQLGAETNGLHSHLPAEERATVIAEAQRTLQRCLPPTAHDDERTGLVIGYVQSGKTMSFTTLVALARDNGYRLIVVITGTSLPLFDQSQRRLVRDLRLEGRSGFNPWKHISKPRLSENRHAEIQNTLAEWNDPDVPRPECRTVLITVNKNHSQLGHLRDVLSRLDLRGVPAIIIDDEGDQAGLNTQVNQGTESPTYSCLLDVKAQLPHHSYLQYTATPQAPLLINIVDILSPSFAEVLTPGQEYVGGADFFLRNAGLVRLIPSQQIPDANVAVNAEPPPTLLEAMRLFFVGVAVGVIRDQSAGRRSMMVHPSQRTDPHRRFYGWVSSAHSEWRRVLELPDGDPDKDDLLHQFRLAYDDLAATMRDMPTFEEVASRLRHALRRTCVREVNARGGATTPINWNEEYGWILVGGQAMDRGFTVEGLTVTYMPRGVGVGNADTVQQRARFFGYKRRYLGLCRVFLGAAVQQVFQAYVEHEEDVRDQMIQFRGTGRPLSDWRREFFLNTLLRPTRHHVIDIAYNRFQLDNRWSYPQEPHKPTAYLENNRHLFNQFLRAHTFVEHDGVDRRGGNSPRNQMARGLPLRLVHAELLTRYRVSSLADSQLFFSLLRAVQQYLEKTPDATCTVFLMAGGHRPRRRGYENDQIKELFQGVQYAQAGGRRITTYPGDSAVRDAGCVSIQMSFLDLGEAGSLVAENVPHLAVWVPAGTTPDVLQQPQGGAVVSGPTPDLVGLFNTLPTPSVGTPEGRFSALPVPGILSCSVGKDASGAPVLLVETDASGPRGAVAPTVLENLSVLHNVDCRLQDADGRANTRRLSVIRCCGDDRRLYDYFLRVLAPIIASLPRRPARRQVVEVINTLVELFRRAAQPPRRTIQGVWAELFVILKARRPEHLIRYWHATPDARFDFAEGGQRLEVKTSASRVRAHHFSHEQLWPPDGSQAVVASVLMERSAGGQNLYDLVDEIRGRVADTALLVQLDAVVAQTLGTDLRSAQDERFDRQLAEGSLRFVDVRTIPSVPLVLPPEVSDVHYRVDLSAHPLTLPDELPQAGGMFEAMLPI